MLRLAHRLPVHGIVGTGSVRRDFEAFCKKIQRTIGKGAAEQRVDDGRPNQVDCCLNDKRGQEGGRGEC